MLRQIAQFHKDNSSGQVVFEIVTKAPMFVAGPVRVDSQALYYDISGAGAAAQPYEWIE